MRLVALLVCALALMGMVAAEPFTNATDANLSDIDALWDHANDLISPDGKNYYGDLAVMLIFVVVMGASIGRFETDKDGLVKSLIAGSFVSLIFAFMLSVGGHVDEIAVGFPFAGLLIGIIVQKITEDY